MSYRVRFFIACSIAYGFGIFACATLADWPWIAAAFNAPLWATVGAAYSDHWHKVRLGEPSGSRGGAEHAESNPTPGGLPLVPPSPSRNEL